MSEQTKIAWTTSSWSPWIGCTEVSPGCDHCYARELDRRHRFGLKKDEGPQGVAPHWGAGVPRYRTKDWKKPLSWNKSAAATGERRFVFPSMCDPFDNEVCGTGMREDFWKLVEATPALTWLLLTKRIGNARLFLPGGWMDPHRGPWPNVWLGASVVNQAEADRDIPKLLATPAAKRFVSYEPALGPVDWRDPPNDMGEPRFSYLERVDGEGPRIDWIIFGGESAQGGAKARPCDLEWARSTVAQCRAAGIPCFVKQLGSNPIYRTMKGYGNGMPNQLMSNGERLKDRGGADPAEWPSDLRIQETPA